MHIEPQRTSSAGYEPALHTLLSLYQQRPDLQANFPEAIDWDFRNLIIWAAAAATGLHDDPAKAELAPHADWYAKNSITNCNGEPPWQDWRCAWKAAATDFPVLWTTMQDSVRTA